MTKPLKKLKRAVQEDGPRTKDSDYACACGSSNTKWRENTLNGWWYLHCYDCGQDCVATQTIEHPEATWKELIPTTPDEARRLRLDDVDEDGLVPFSPEAVQWEMEHGDPGFHKD